MALQLEELHASATDILNSPDLEPDFFLHGGDLVRIEDVGRRPIIVRWRKDEFAEVLTHLLPIEKGGATEASAAKARVKTLLESRVPEWRREWMAADAEGWML